MTSSFMFIALLNLRCASGRSFAGYPAESGSGGAPFAETPNGLGARENCLISSVESEVENPLCGTLSSGIAIQGAARGRELGANAGNERFDLIGWDVDVLEERFGQRRRGFGFVVTNDGGAGLDERV